MKYMYKLHQGTLGNLFKVDILRTAFEFVSIIIYETS